MRLRSMLMLTLALLVGLLWMPLFPAAAAESSVLTPAQEKLLSESRYVYVQSQREDGVMSTPAEIWFLYHDGYVYVGTSPKSYRVKRILAGRPRAKVAIAKLEGESFWAKAEIVKDPAVEALLIDTYSKKYADDGWSKWEKSFRDGFKDGSRVVVKYTPTRE